MKLSLDLYESIINTAQDCVFWKDKDRRFVGVNQAFLDYYGFKDDSCLIGKTDEDMGWHSDPEPYKQDELRVLQGESTYKVIGKCIVRGEERDIIASKRPLYENGEIVGLVGSFVDITDVLSRQSRMDGHQILYTIDSLRQFRFFDKLLDEKSLDEILDSLTGVVSRAYALNFANDLIASNIPFSFTILDLDNFKFINDTYGHSTGDFVLQEITKSLVNYTRGFGLIGRFGGDELLIINLRDLKYTDKQKFFTEMYNDRNIMRRNIKIEDGNLFVTGTSGCASFPEDADNYNDLFSLIDKSLYLGKNKGRNCYVIYMKDKYENVEIKDIRNHSIFTDMFKLRNLFGKGASLRERLSFALPYFSEIIQITDLYVIDLDSSLKAVLDNNVNYEVEDVSNILTDDMFKESSLDRVSEKCPSLYKALSNLEIKSCMIVRVGNEIVTSGYLLCGVNRKHRIWQDSECALFYYLSSLVSNSIKNSLLQLI